MNASITNTTNSAGKKAIATVTTTAGALVTLSICVDSVERTIKMSDTEARILSDMLTQAAREARI